jgi:hypothetical protein
LWDPDETAPVIIQILEKGRDVEVSSLADEESGALQDRLLTGLQNLKSEWETRESKLDQARREQQLASRTATLEFLANRAEERLKALVEKQAAPFAIRMAEARVDKTRRELSAFLSAPPISSWGGIEHEEVAVGLLRVEPEGDNA